MAACPEELHDGVSCIDELQRLRRINRLYGVLSAVNRAITRKPGQQELLQEICHILVETGGFRFAWYGLPDADGWVIPAAASGEPNGYLDGIRVSIHDIPEGGGPAGTAIRERRHVICNDVPASPVMGPWREALQRHDIFSAAGFPVLLPDGGTAGLIVYSTDRDFFSSAEVALLEEICRDIGYALEFSATAAVLERERTLLKALVGAIPDLVWLKNPDGVYLSCNKSFSRFFGAPEVAIIGRTDHDFVSTDLAEFFRTKDQEAMALGCPSKNDEWVTFADDGHSALLETIKTPVFGHWGEILGVLGVARDVTATRLNEQLLRESAQQQRSILQTAMDGFWLVDCLGRLQEVNEAYCRMSGYSEAELLDMSIPELEETETAEATASRIRKILNQGEDRFESRHRRKDGSVFDVEVSVRYHPVAGGRMYVFLRDITESKRILAALKESEQRFKDVVLASADWVWEIDRNGRYTYASRNVEQILGYSVEELLGKTPFDVMDPVDAEVILSQFREIARHKEPFRNLVNINRHKDGTLRTLLTTGIPILDQQGELLGYRGMDRDVTELKEVETELRTAKDAAEFANRAKSRFLANMSHELRTPLNGVLGMIQLAQLGNLSEEQQGYLDSALNAGFALVRILNDILDLSKIEAEMITVVPEPFILRGCISDTHRVLQSEVIRKGLRFAVTIDDTLPETVVGDPVRLRQVLTNLIGNAVKFTNQGEVSLRVNAVLGGITFVVTDSGIGIPADKQHLLFKPFSQVDDSPTRYYGGTGLGLVISRKLVELMGGTISCDSDEGVGSTFTVTVPLQGKKLPASSCSPGQDEAFSAISPAEIAADAGTIPRILVVEDDPTNRAFVHTALESEGLAVETAANGVQALEMWENGGYGLIIMDVQMPVMDGLEATKAIRDRERSRGGHIPILAMTAHAYDTDVERCLSAGMDQYLAKPVQLADMITTVRNLLLGEQFTEQPPEALFFPARSDAEVMPES